MMFIIFIPPLLVALKFPFLRETIFVSSAPCLFPGEAGVSSLFLFQFPQEAMMFTLPLPPLLVVLKFQFLQNVIILSLVSYLSPGEAEVSSLFLFHFPGKP
jgi:hypothetical protein